MHSVAADAILQALADTVAQIVADRVIAALRAPGAAAAEPLYMRVPAYAKRIAVSERHAWTLVRQGLPTIGEGRTRRVDVAAADQWLRSRTTSATDDAIEVRARADARRAASWAK